MQDLHFLLVLIIMSHAINTLERQELEMTLTSAIYVLPHVQRVKAIVTMILIVMAISFVA